MSWMLSRKPVTFVADKASSIINRMIRRYNEVDRKETGELAVRILGSIRTFFSTLRRSSITEDMKVSPLEGPSSEKMNRFFHAMTEDLETYFSQQNEIDKVVVENHNLVTSQQSLIRNSLKIATDKLSELDSVVGENNDSALIVFEDQFDTLQKTDLETPVALPRADVDTVMGVVRLKNDSFNIELENIQEVTLIPQFDGVVLSINNDMQNTFSDGKLYGDPRESGENGIRYGMTGIIEGVNGYLPSPFPGNINPGGGTTDPRDIGLIVLPGKPVIEDPSPWDPGDAGLGPEDPPIIVDPNPKPGIGDGAGSSGGTYLPDPGGVGVKPGIVIPPQDDISLPESPYMPDPIIITPGADPRKNRTGENTDGSSQVITPKQAQAQKQEFNLFKRSGS